MSYAAKSADGLNGVYYGPAIPPSATHRSVGRSSSGCCCNPLTCLISTIFKFVFSVVITVGIILLIIWLLFRPNELKVFVESADLAAFDLSNSSTLNYNLSLAVSIRNPNRRIAIYYDQLDATAFYDGTRFAYDAALPLFFQDHKNTTVVSPAFAGREAALGAVAGAFGREKGEGSFYVQVKINARIRLKVKFVKVGHFKPKFVCNVKLPAPPAKGGSPAPAPAFERTRCDVDWI